ncbi:MAG: Gar1/Naf1 family protein [Candidatus Bathyarchaeota archaeon]
MEGLGKVLHVSSSTGNLIVKVRRQVKVGEKVYDSKLKQIGAVFDIFGPILTPYVSIKPILKDPAPLVNQTLYLFSGKKRRK